MKIRVPTAKRSIWIAAGTATFIAAASTASARPLSQNAATSTATRTVIVANESQLQQAVQTATPGTLISVKAGSYSGQLSIKTSGTAAQPIVLQPYGDGAVTLTAILPTRPCTASGPDPDRTVRFRTGASYWTIKGVTIDGGVYIAGKNVDLSHSWFRSQILSHNWQARRLVPGRGTNDPVLGRTAVSYLSKKLGVTLAPADGIQLINDTITRKGVFIAMARYGIISGSTVKNIACGSGPGIWLITYSDGWSITNNTLSNIQSNSSSHYMQEAVRLDGASNYNTVQSNTVSSLPTDGRAFTADQDASYNTYVSNKANAVFVGFSDEMSGWGNQWLNNTVTAYRGRGFDLGAKDAPLSSPSFDTTPRGALVECNQALGTGDGLFVGQLAGSTFAHNKFGSVHIAKSGRNDWVSAGNTWEGRRVVPPTNPAGTLSNCPA